MRKLIILVCCFLGFTISAQIDGVGINTTEPKSTLDINGNLSLKVVSLNGGASTTATPIDDGVYINLTPTAGSPQFILPNASNFPGRIYVLRNISDTVIAEIYSFGGLLFAGDSSGTSTPPIEMDPDTAGNGGDVTKTLIFISDGTNWTFGMLGF